MSKELCPRCKQEPVIESSHTKDGKFYCLVCSGIMVVNEGTTLGQQKDVTDELMSSREEIELARELFEGAGQLKGLKIERAQILCHLRSIAHTTQVLLPNSLDARLLLDIAHMIESRAHWNRHEEEPDGE